MSVRLLNPPSGTGPAYCVDCNTGRTCSNLVGLVDQGLRQYFDPVSNVTANCYFVTDTIGCNCVPLAGVLDRDTPRASSYRLGDASSTVTLPVNTFTYRIIRDFVFSGVVFCLDYPGGPDCSQKAQQTLGYFLNRGFYTPSTPVTTTSPSAPVTTTVGDSPTTTTIGASPGTTGAQASPGGTTTGTPVTVTLPASVPTARTGSTGAVTTLTQPGANVPNGATTPATAAPAPAQPDGAASPLSVTSMASVITNTSPVNVQAGGAVSVAGRTIARAILGGLLASAAVYSL